jgi:hypothetical protein
MPTECKNTICCLNCASPDGRYIYVGAYSDSAFSILRVDGTKVTDTGKHFKVPGQPGVARMSPH